MTARRAPAGLLAAAALVPPVFWLFPALVSHSAPSVRDQGDFFYPLKLYTADRLRAGEIPLWNPLSGCGEPWLANLQSGVFYPPGLFFLLPGAALAAALFLLFHFGVAVWGMRRFLREEGASEAAAAAGAAVFAASGFAASLSVYWNHFGGYAWLPAIASFARSGLERRSQRIGLALCIGLQAMAGSPELSAASLALAALLLWRARARVDGDVDDGGGSGGGGFQASAGRRLARGAAAAALGGLLAAWALVPFAELALRSDRRGALPAAERESGAVTWAGAASAAGITTAGGSGTSYLASIAIGPLALLAAAAALRERERRRLAWLLAAVAAAGVLLASAGPIGAALRSIPPLDRIRYPAKALAPALFALAALAGFGFDTLRFVPNARGSKAGALAMGAAAAATAAALLAFSSAPLPARAAEAAGVAALLGCAAAASRPRLSAALQAAAALALVAAFAISGAGLFAFVPEAEVRRRPETVAFLGGLPGRVLTPPMATLVPGVLREGGWGSATLRRQRESLIGYTNLLGNVRTIRTASPLATQGSRGIADAIDASPHLQTTAGSASGRVLWTPFVPPDMGSRKIGDFYRAPINPYRPRISFVHGFAVEPDAAAAWKRRASGETDWSRSVFLDRDPSPRPIEGSGKGAFLVARVEEDRPERVAAQVHSDGAGILVMTDLAYPGWRAEADGKPAEILRADGFFRGVALPAGEHRVVFTYRPIAFYAGAALSLLAIGVLFGLARRGEPRRAGAIL